MKKYIFILLTSTALTLSSHASQEVNSLETAVKQGDVYAQKESWEKMIIPPKGFEVARDHRGDTQETQHRLRGSVSGFVEVCARTPQVRDGIMEAAEKASCADVTQADVAAIDVLILENKAISSLLAGDFSGLSNLRWLRLENNNLSTLPAGIFNGLSNLIWLDLSKNNLSTLPAGIFNGLSNLEGLWLHGNNLSTSYCRTLSINGCID